MEKLLLIISILLIIIYFSKKRLKSLENNVFEKIMLANEIGLIIEICCYFTVANMNSVPVINSILTKLLLIYYLLYIVLFSIYVFVISYKKEGKT